MEAKPKKVNILGIDYIISYHANPSEVDIHKRQSLWGQIDYWTRTIRIYHNDNPIEDVWQTLIHEIMHGIASGLNLDSFNFEDKEKHDDLDVMSIAIADVLFRNGWLKIEE